MCYHISEWWHLVEVGYTAKTSAMQPDYVIFALERDTVVVLFILNELHMEWNSYTKQIQKNTFTSTFYFQ